MKNMLKQAEDGGVDYDEAIGSILERWLTTPRKGKCRFCGKSISEELKPSEQFCSSECKKSFEKVMDARVAIGLRDLKRRGYD